LIYPLNTASLKAFRSSLPDLARIYVGGCSGEPVGLYEAFRAAPELARGLTFLGVWIPGVNCIDWAGLSEDSYAETIFLSPDLAASARAGRTRHLPLSYNEAWRWLGSTPLDAAIVVVSPEADGLHSLGVSTDFAPAVLARQSLAVTGLVNSAMPFAARSPTIASARFTARLTDAQPLTTVQPTTLSPPFNVLAKYVSALISPGDTVQFGLGSVQYAVLNALAEREDLGGGGALHLHAGMISDPALELLDKGQLASITVGVAIGSSHLYRRLADTACVRFCPVGHTHAIETLAAIPRLKAINSVLEVDLYGQANAEFLDNTLISGTGGLVDFLRGAALSPGGRGIICLLSSAKSGTISRIVPRLTSPAVSIARADMDTVVTEHGIAELRGKTADQRAEALIAIAAPQHRDLLRTAWREQQT